MAEFPVLFQVEGSNRHEVMLITTKYTVEDLKTTMNGLITSSANFAEFLGKYRGKGVKDTVVEIKACWAREGRDKQLFPKETTFTEDNCRAVLSMLAAGVGKDVLAVKVRTSKEENEDP